MEWSEFRIWYGKKPDRKKLYDLRRSIFSILDEHEIGDFLVLNEPQFALFRVEVEARTRKDVEESLRSLVEHSGGAFSKVTVEKWSPEEDARGRILGAVQRLGLKLEEGKGWMIVGREPAGPHWIPAEDDLDFKIREFGAFMTKVVGRFTRAYVENMPRQVEDRWLLSVFVHLLLNSISLNQIQEDEVRDFPYV